MVLTASVVLMTAVSPGLADEPVSPSSGSEASAPAVAEAPEAGPAGTPAGEESTPSSSLDEGGDDSTTPAAEPTAVVACAYANAGASEQTRASVPVLGAVWLVDLAEAQSHGFDGTFPFQWRTTEVSVQADRYAEPGESVESAAATTVCGEVAGEQVAGESGIAVEAPAVVAAPPADRPRADVLPATGAPTGVVAGIGVALVLAGIGLIRRRPAATP